MPVDPQPETSVVDSASRMDAVIGLLESTADGLAAEWDLREDGQAIELDNSSGRGPEPWIQ